MIIDACRPILFNEIGGVCTLPEKRKSQADRRDSRLMRSSDSTRVKRTLTALLLMFVLSLSAAFAEGEASAPAASEGSGSGTVQTGGEGGTASGGEQSPAALCQQLVEAGLGALSVAIGERLSYEDERIATMTAEEGAKWDGSALAVLTVWPAPSCKRSTPGFPDEAFIRGKVPMTKRMIRMSVLGLLNPQDDEVCWDVGAGTGSVSVELSMFARRVYAIEKKPEAVDLLRQNREEFCAYNMRIVEGEAPAALQGLETPDVVFIGGSSGRIGAILDCLPQTGVRLCVTAVTLETLEDARKAMESAGFAPQITQVAVTDIKPVGDYHMMDSQNPVFIIYGER